MTSQDYQQIILEGIDSLPQEVLAEIADFVLFMRKRTMQPDAFQSEIQNVLLRHELKQLSRGEESHSEKEFENYEQFYPRE